MATLTSSYQYLGRSSVMNSTGGSLSYYILLYGKTTANQTTGIHTVTIKEVLASTNTDATYYYYVQAHNGKINGTTAFSGTDKPSTDWNKTNLTESGVTYKTWIVLGEGSVNVDATDGNAKNITLSCYYAFNDTAASYTPAKGTNRTVSVTATLAAIPRATTPTFSASPYTMGTALTITLNPANSTFKHKFGYDFGNLKGQTSGLSIGTNFTAQGNTSITFTPPTTLGSQIPNANSGTCTIYCYTYTSSGTHIGTKSSTITINVPTYTPEITNVTLTGNNLLNGVYVGGKSTVTVNAVLKNYYGAGTKSVVVETDAKQYTTLPCTSSVLSSGNRIVKITFTDTRNKSATYTSSTFTVYPYSPPTITAFSLERQADGTTVIASMSGSISPLNNKNTKSFSITLNGVTNNLTVSGYEINGSTTFTNVPTDNSFTATAQIADYYTLTKKNATLPTVAVTMDFYKDGNGVAMGKVAEYGDLLDVNWPLRGRKTLTVDGTVTHQYNLFQMGHIYMGGNKTSDGEKHIKFSNPDDSANPHNVYIYGGSPTGGVAIGVYDAKNNRPVMGYTDSNNRIAFGNGSAEIYFNGTKFANYVVEEGTSGVWTYRKWNTGVMEVFGTASQSPTALSNGTNSVTVTMPVSFVDTAFTVVITPAKCGLLVSAFGDCNSSNEITHTKNTFVLSYKYNHSTAYTVNFNVRAVGKWK